MSIRRPSIVAGAVLAVALAVAACSSSETTSVPSDPVLAQGQRTYLQYCASCHGRGGGGGLGPKLEGVVAERYPNVEDQKAIILNGQGSMPAFKGRFDEAELDALVRYTREGL
ncbi:MAG: cytochrome c [Acidimicrobiales bacterium]|jgi:mono/diheme cytochrome c family protein|nr:cytochrome c [Acidimicrobiales bacterium]